MKRPHFLLGRHPDMSESSFFKLDGLIIKDDQKSFVFMVNFNVPYRYLTDDSLAAEKFEIMKKCISDEFQQEIERRDLTYSIASNCELTNRQTGETRLWEGSFQNRTNQELFIKDDVTFETDSFVAEALESARAENVVRHLTWAGLNSVWTLSKVNSAIFSFQTRCYYASHKFRANSLILPSDRQRDLEQNRSIQFKRYLELSENNEFLVK